jgi:hypothetical protein
MYLLTVYIEYSDCLHTLLNPLAERTCFSQFERGRNASGGAGRDAGGGGTNSAGVPDGHRAGAKDTNLTQKLSQLQRFTDILGQPETFLAAGARELDPNKHA